MITAPAHLHPLSTRALHLILTLGDLLDVWQPDANRRYTLDLLCECQLTPEDLVELGHTILHDARTVPALTSQRSQLHQLVQKLKHAPVHALQA